MPEDTGITLAEAKTQLARWLLADAAVSENQEYWFESNGSRRRLVQADAGEIRRNIEFWDTKVRELASGGVMRVYGVIPP